jgi:glycogen debranching enzyme
MGGLWAHPIKLMDGFSARLKAGGETVVLGGHGPDGQGGTPADRFTNFPMANRHAWELGALGLEVARWQFVPDGAEGVLLEYSLRNKNPHPLTLTFEFRGYADLRPTWLGERTGMQDARDRAVYDSTDRAWMVKDENNPWWVALGTARKPAVTRQMNSPYAGKGRGLSLEYSLEIPASGNEVLRFALAGSSASEIEARNTYSNLLMHAGELLQAKRDRYEGLAEKSRLTVPDTALQKAFEWLKYNSDWMVQEVPGIGRGIAAGIPDYPWWFGVDSEYALRGYMAVGQTDIVYETIRLLDSVSEAVNGNGRIIHEMSTNGAVFNPGNINETPQFASLIWHVYRWGGDKAFLERYFPTVRKGLKWLLQANDANGNGFPDGFGMMEIHGLDSEMIDVAAYTQAGFRHAALIAAELGEDALAAEFGEKAAELKEKINTEFWSERFGSYADFLGTDAQALRLIEDAIVRADTLDKPWAVAELEATRAALRANPGPGLRPFVLHHNWVVNTPMEVGIADTAKALRALETARKFTNPFGVFVTGIDRDEAAGTDEGSFQGSQVFSYTGAVMTLPTGVQAIAENNYGRPDRALDYLQRMTRSFSYALPGSMYEVSPDYGMMAQAWNIFSFAVPVVEQFFGISPLAAAKKVLIKPSMPTAWEQASLENVQTGENSLSVFFGRLPDGEVHLKVVQAQPGWTLSVPLTRQEALNMEGLSGTLERKADGSSAFTTTGDSLELRYKPQRP